MNSIMKKAIACLLAVLITASAAAIRTSACTSIYIGGELTDDGSTLFARSEDLEGSVDKLFLCREAGFFREGETLSGCFGFDWTFTHDSYAYTAFPDDNGEGVEGVCPSCGSTEENHVSYEEAGTNEKGLIVSATESLYENPAICEIDPLVDGGITEAEMPTILLSECETAREAVELLLSIYDTSGAGEANGLFIADSGEVWYIENLSGHHYIALLLPDDIVFIEPNQSVIGPIDLDDADHVIASEGLIETAMKAGTFVGDAEENIIDFRNSYSSIYYSARMGAGLNYLGETEVFNEEAPIDSDYVISNVDEDGALVGLYTNITLTRPFTVDDAVNFYKVDYIGHPGNQETHIFQLSADEEDPASGIVEWVSMGDGKYTLFVPCYPMLITDTYEGYQISTATVEFVSEEPDAGLAYYPYTEEGFRVLPENWRDSYYWAFDAVAELIVNGVVSEEDAEKAVMAYEELQQEIYVRFAEQQEAISDMTPEDVSEYVTADSAAMAQDAHMLALSLYDKLTEDVTDSEETDH